MLSFAQAAVTNSETVRRAAPNHFVTFIRSSLFLNVMNNYLSIGFTLYHSFIHQHEVKVTEPNKGKRTLLSKFIYILIPKLTSEIVLDPFMIKYRKSYKKGVHTVRSVQPFYKILLTLFFSSILLSLFVCLYPPIQGEPAFMMFYTPIFLFIISSLRYLYSCCFLYSPRLFILFI